MERLGLLIGYPERVPEGAVSFVFRVDDDPVEVKARSGTLQFRWMFPEGAPVASVAEYATGRFLRDPAVVSWDPFRARVMLWLQTPRGVGDGEMVESFRVFLGSCDWWKRCVKEMVQPKAAMAEIVIRP